MSDDEVDPLDEAMTVDAWRSIVGAQASFTLLEGRMTIAGIEWATYAPSRRHAQEIVKTLVDVASRLVKEQESSGTASPTWLRFKAKDLGDGVEEGGIAIGHEHLTWVTSYEQDWSVTRVGFVPLSLLPRNVATIESAVVDLKHAAALAIERPPGRCRFCGETFAAIDLHDATTCHHCAETRLGIIH